MREAGRGGEVSSTSSPVDFVVLLGAGVSVLGCGPGQVAAAQVAGGPGGFTSPIT